MIPDMPAFVTPQQSESGDFDLEYYRERASSFEAYIAELVQKQEEEEEADRKVEYIDCGPFGYRQLEVPPPISKFTQRQLSDSEIQRDARIEKLLSDNCYEEIFGMQEETEERKISAREREALFEDLKRRLHEIRVEAGLI